MEIGGKPKPIAIGKPNPILILIHNPNSHHIGSSPIRISSH